MQHKPRVGITIGDLNGIGLEVILKALSNPQLINLCTPVIFGSTKVFAYHKNIVGLDDIPYYSQRSAERLRFDRINIINCWDENIKINLGHVTEEGGKYAASSLKMAIECFQKGEIDLLVTAPIHKKAMEMANFGFPGHTEFLSHSFQNSDNLMFMVHDSLRVGLVTSHVPLKMVPELLTKKLILRKLRLMIKSLQMDFGIEKPTIAVLGLNPHAGDDEVLGDEEEKIIRPAIVEAKKKGHFVLGPFAADGFFGSGQFRKVDGILAMYHDQGLIPFKALSFGEGVNFTAGMPLVRTSPDHGTGLDIAGKNVANHQSFLKALLEGIQIFKNRVLYAEMYADPLNKENKVDPSTILPPEQVVEEEEVPEEPVETIALPPDEIED